MSPVLLPPSRETVEHPSPGKKLTRALSDSASFRYVRSVAVGLPSARAPVQTIALPVTPSPRKPVRRKTGSRAGSVDLDEGDVRPIVRPLSHRSESLPVFPPIESPKPSSLAWLGTLDDLPQNPKLWTPSQLAVYLAHVLKLTPAPLVRGDIAYVVTLPLTFSCRSPTSSASSSIVVSLGDASSDSSV
jgi:hypothetical protein